jgi:hypothetical protein
VLVDTEPPPLPTVRPEIDASDDVVIVVTEGVLVNAVVCVVLSLKVMEGELPDITVVMLYFPKPRFGRLVR